jgi:hypothetical protein
MRLALCLSGQPRTWRWTRESLAAYFAGHQVDIFLHTWREGDPAELEALVAAYAPRAWLIEERPLFVEEKRLLAERFPTRPPLTIFDMLHSVAESLKLAAEAGETYDVVVRARFDALFDGVWSGELPAAGELIIPDLYLDPTGCTDQLAIGRPAEMQVYAAMGVWLGRVIGQVDRGDWLRPEPVLRQYLEPVSGLKVAERPIAMKLCRDDQAGLSYAELTEAPLFHAAKHEAWERFAREQFPDVAAHADFQHPARTALEQERALTAWLADRPKKDLFQLFKSPWSRRILAMDAFIAGQTGPLDPPDDAAYQTLRTICATLLHRMNRKEPMTLESFVVHLLSANVDDMQRASDWATTPGRLDGLPKLAKSLGPITRALSYANPLEQTGVRAWPTT